jgi:hypothetical protein
MVTFLKNTIILKYKQHLIKIKIKIHIFYIDPIKKINYKPNTSKYSMKYEY